MVSIAAASSRTVDRHDPLVHPARTSRASLGSHGMCALWPSSLSGPPDMNLLEGRPVGRAVVLGNDEPVESATTTATSTSVFAGPFTISTSHINACMTIPHRVAPRADRHAERDRSASGHALADGRGLPTTLLDQVNKHVPAPSLPGADPSNASKPIDVPQP